MNAEAARQILDTATCAELMRLRKMLDAELAHRCECCQRERCVLPEKPEPQKPK